MAIISNYIAFFLSLLVISSPSQLFKYFFKRIFNIVEGLMIYKFFKYISVNKKWITKLKHWPAKQFMTQIRL